MDGALQFRVAGNGATYANGPYSGSGADYAERFESVSGRKIAPGTSVVLEGDKVRAATSEDELETVIGVIRPEGAASMVGNDAANQVSVTPSGDLKASDVQAALLEPDLT